MRADANSKRRADTETKLRQARDDHVKQEPKVVFSQALDEDDDEKGVARHSNSRSKRSKRILEDSATTPQMKQEQATKNEPGTAMIEGNLDHLSLGLRLKQQPRESNLTEIQRPRDGRGSAKAMDAAGIDQAVKE